MKIEEQKGLIAIISLLGVTVVALSVISSLVVLSIGELKMSRAGGPLDNTYYAAEAGLNEALYRLIANPAPAVYNFVWGAIPVQAQVTANPDNPYQRIVRSRASDPGGKVRTVQIIANTSSFAGGFDYAVQGGAGGVFLDNNSTVVGGIYSNGSILPASGGARGNVTGSAWAAGAKIDRVIITGDVHAHSIERSEVSGNAFYQTIDGASKVGGTACPNANCHPGFPDPSPRDFPIGDAEIQVWKDDIASTGNPVLLADPAVCPPAHNVGFYCVTSNSALGYQKIQGDFYVGNGATLTLDGNLWVTGKIILDNNGTIRVDPALGAGSVVIIADGIVDVNNNYTIQGTGNPASFILVISMSPSVNVSAPAVYAANNSESIVFAALHGMLKVKNNGQLNAAVAEVLYLEPNSQVTFNPFLTAFYIPNGGGDEVGTALGSWQEL